MLYDAHLHLQDARLAAVLGELPRVYGRLGVARVVVNGTCPQDWPAVLKLAQNHEFIIPSFGLHPWQVNNAPNDWLEQLKGTIDTARSLKRPVGIGECGLDKWVKDHDLDRQKHAFRLQLELAAERNLPLSIHCLQAWGSLLGMLTAAPPPARGFLLHSYGGPPEMVDPFIQAGAYFSISGYFLREDKSHKLDAFRKVPTERLLIETDAPDMLPPTKLITHKLRDTDVNHPAHLVRIYEAVSDRLCISLKNLKNTVANNFTRLFLAG